MSPAKMKMKTKQIKEFIVKLHNHIINDPQFRRDTRNKSEREIQAEIRPLIIDYLEKHFTEAGYKDSTKKAHASFYWEGQEGVYDKERKTTFGDRNYPDFIITNPHLVAVEYKQSDNVALVKQGIGQSIMYTVSGDFFFVYYLFHDQNIDKRIKNSINGESERHILDLIWSDFNVYMKII
jgi:hypothetical protein